MKKGFTLIETILGSAFVLIIFLGIVGVFLLGTKLIGQADRRITATAIAAGEIEKIRNLPYLSVGTKNALLPFASGVLDRFSTTTFNTLEYTIERDIKYVIDEADGVGEADECNWDYKRVKIRVSWAGAILGGVEFYTDISPKDKVEELQVCQSQPGGILSVMVYDAYGNMVNSPLIQVFDGAGGLIDSALPISGRYDFPLPAGTYRVVASKDGYSSERTYSFSEIVAPEKPNPIIIEGKITPLSFSIDITGTININTFYLRGSGQFYDSFIDESKISEKDGITVLNGRAYLATTTDGYLSDGYFFTTDIFPENLYSWQEFSVSFNSPEDTWFKYQFYYASGTNWLIVPDGDIPENSSGINSSVFDLSVLDKDKYNHLKIKFIFHSDNSSSTPLLDSWQLSYITEDSTPLPNITFNIHGTKIIGYDERENPVYKYSQNKTSDSGGRLSLSNMEWDSYFFSSIGDLNLVNTDPSSQPFNLSPGVSLTANLYFDAQDTLLLTVQDDDTLSPVFSSSVRIYNNNYSYDQTQYTNEKGQVFFVLPSAGVYSIKIDSISYDPLISSIDISGNTFKTIKIHRIE